MAKDFLKVLEEVRGTGVPQAPYTDGIYHDLTIKTVDDDGTVRLGKGIYGSMQVMHEDLSLADNKNINIVAENMDTIIAEGIALTDYGPLNSAPVDGEINPTTGKVFILGLGHKYFDIPTNSNMVLTNDFNGALVWARVTLDHNTTTVTHGNGVPGVSINPINGVNAMYMDDTTNTGYVCKDATPNANEWVVSGTGQFSDIGTSIGKGVQFMAQESGVEDIVVKAGTNAFSISGFKLADGASLTITDGATYKIL